MPALPLRRQPAFRPFGPRTGPLDGFRFVGNPKGAFETQYALVIDPSALPHGAGLQIWVSGTPGASRQFPAGHEPGEGQPAVHRLVVAPRLVVRVGG